MSKGPSVDGRRILARFAVVMLASLVCAFGAAWPKAIAAQQSVPVPD